MEKRTFKVGLLISTYNWPKALETIFASIQMQSRMPDEIIIADDGSGPATADVIRRWEHILRVPFKHAWHEDDGFRKTIILNKAVKLSEVDYIIEIDGDILLHPRFVDDHVRNARRGRFLQGARSMFSES
jgi:glycosyltransferase involved in cell wall biosynthesis